MTLTYVVKNDVRRYGIKKHAAVDVENGYTLSTNITRVSERIKNKKLLFMENRL